MYATKELDNLRYELETLHEAIEEARSYNDTQAIQDFTQQAKEVEEAISEAEEQAYLEDMGYRHDEYYHTKLY